MPSSDNEDGPCHGCSPDGSLTTKRAAIADVGTRQLSFRPNRRYRLRAILIIGPVAGTPRQQQEYSRPGPAGQAGKNEDHGVGFEICVAIDNGDVSLGAGDIDREAGRQGRSAYTLDRNETEPCAGIALNHEPDPPATKYADPVEQDEPIGNVVEAPRHPSLAHPILHPQSTTANRFVVDAPRVMLRAQTVGRPGDALSGRCPSCTRNLAAGTVSFLVTYRRP